MNYLATLEMIDDNERKTEEDRNVLGTKEFDDGPIQDVQIQASDWALETMPTANYCPTKWQGINIGAKREIPDYSLKRFLLLTHGYVLVLQRSLITLKMAMKEARETPHENLIIFAKRPFTPQSNAIIIKEPLWHVKEYDGMTRLGSCQKANYMMSEMEKGNWRVRSGDLTTPEGRIKAFCDMEEVTYELTVGN